MRPRPGEVLHFSEDPAIRVFRPYDRAPDYWFPRQCPRAMAWLGPRTSAEDRSRIIGDGCGTRVHAVEYGWLEAMRTIELYAYRLPAEPFQPIDSAMVATTMVEPLGPPERVGDLFELHAEAGIQLRVLPQLLEFWDAVTASTLEFSGIRLRNAVSR